MQDSESASGLSSTISEPSAWGVPASEAPPKYSWLGAIEIPTELSSGLANMGVRTYIPQLGRFLQPDPDPSGSPNAYAYTYGDPLQETDATGQYAEYKFAGPAATIINWLEQDAAAAAAQRAAEEAAARAAAERAAAEAAAAEAAAYGPSAGEEEWWEEEWGEEEGGEEYASYDKGGRDNEEARQREAEQEAGFGPGVALEIASTSEPHAGEAVTESGKHQEPDNSEPAPEEHCSGGSGEPGGLQISSGPGHREYVHGEQCPANPKSPWYKKHARVRIHTKTGSWTTVFTTYCGIVDGAALVPGVDVFGAPVTVACAGYSAYRAVETIVEFL
jgi:RHS repeat-associated protein